MSAAHGLPGVRVAVGTCSATPHHTSVLVVVHAASTSCVVSGISVADRPSSSRITIAGRGVIAAHPRAARVVPGVGVVVLRVRCITAVSRDRVVVRASPSCSYVAGVWIRPCSARCRHRLCCPNDRKRSPLLRLRSRPSPMPVRRNSPIPSLPRGPTMDCTMSRWPCPCQSPAPIRRSCSKRSSLRLRKCTEPYPSVGGHVRRIVIAGSIDHDTAGGHDGSVVSRCISDIYDIRGGAVDVNVRDVMQS